MRTFTSFAITLVAVATFAAAPAAFAEADVDNGKKIFVKCGICHSIEKDAAKVGPSLHGVLGRKAGTLASFKLYSKAMKESEVVWSDKTIAEFLKSPRDYIKGTRMIFAGLKDDKAIADLLAYIKSFSK